MTRTRRLQRTTLESFRTPAVTRSVGIDTSCGPSVPACVFWFKSTRLERTVYAPFPNVVSDVRLGPGDTGRPTPSSRRNAQGPLLNVLLVRDQLDKSTRLHVVGSGHGTRVSTVIDGR